MSKSTMLRTRRRDVNIKPNRSSGSRLDRKSSRGMIYENEELRLRTININAEVEKGQSDIKKLRRENEQLRREIWCLRDEYEKLDHLLKTQCAVSDSDTDSEDSSCSSCSCQSCDEPSCETSQNQENVEKITNQNRASVNFDHLSVVSEEKSSDNINSDENYFYNDSKQHKFPAVDKTTLVLRPDEPYPSDNFVNSVSSDGVTTVIANGDDFMTNEIHENINNGVNLAENNEAMMLKKTPKHFFSPLPSRKINNFVNIECDNVSHLTPTTNPFFCPKTGPDIYIDQISVGEPGKSESSSCAQTPTVFQTGGNLEELLQDMEVISNDILKLSTNKVVQRQDAVCMSNENVQNFVKIDVSAESTPDLSRRNTNLTEKPFKSELNVVLMPNPMSLLGFEKYNLTQQSNPDISSQKQYDDACKNSRFGPFKRSQTLPTQQSLQNFEYNGQTNMGNISPGNDFTASLNSINSPKNIEPFFVFPDRAQYCQNCYSYLESNKNIPLANCYCQNCARYGFENQIGTNASPQSPQNFDYPQPELLPVYQHMVVPQSIKLTNTDNNEKISDSTGIQNLKPTTPFATRKIGVSGPMINLEELKNAKDIDKGVTNKTIDDCNVDKVTSSSDDKTLSKKPDEIPKSPGKIRKLRKLSIHFNGAKKAREKLNRSASLDTNTLPKNDKPELGLNRPLTPTTLDHQKNVNKLNLSNIPENSEVDDTSKNGTSVSPKLDRKISTVSSSPSGDKKHVKIEHKKHKHESSSKKRRKTSADKLRRYEQKSLSLDMGGRLNSRHFDWSNKYDSYNEFTTSLSERERTNSLTSESSRNTGRKMSTLSNFSPTGKVPWCGCWGNGCL